MVWPPHQPCLVASLCTPAQVLAKKMIAIMELSQQQLSKQDHYDYGLRSFVIPIARAAGSLKRVAPDDSEEVCTPCCLYLKRLPNLHSAYLPD